MYYPPPGRTDGAPGLKLGEFGDMYYVDVAGGLFFGEKPVLRIRAHSDYELRVRGRKPFKMNIWTYIPVYILYMYICMYTQYADFKASLRRLSVYECMYYCFKFKGFFDSFSEPWAYSA